MSNIGVPVREFNMQLVPNFSGPLDARTAGESAADRPAQIYEGLIRYESALGYFVYATKVNEEWTWKSLVSKQDFDDIKQMLYTSTNYTSSLSLDQRLINYDREWEEFQTNIASYSSMVNELLNQLKVFQASVVTTPGVYANSKTIDERLKTLEAVYIQPSVATLQTTVNELMAKVDLAMSWICTDNYSGEVPIDQRLYVLEVYATNLYDRTSEILNNIDTADASLNNAISQLNALYSQVNSLSNSVTSGLSALSNLQAQAVTTFQTLTAQYNTLKSQGDTLTATINNTFLPRMAFFRFTGVVERYTLNAATGFYDNSFGPWLMQTNVLGVSFFTAGAHWWKMPLAGVYEIVVTFESMAQQSNQNGRSRVAVMVQDGTSYSLLGEGFGFNEWNNGGYQRRQCGIVLDMVYTITNPDSVSFLTKIIDLNGKVMNWSIKFIHWA